MHKVTLNWDYRFEFTSIEQVIGDLRPNEGGIYLWLFKGPPERVCYVSETRDFRARFMDHFKKYFMGEYALFPKMRQSDYIDFLLCEVVGKELEQLYRSQTFFYPKALEGNNIRKNRLKANFNTEDVFELVQRTLKDSIYMFAPLELEKNVRVEIVVQLQKLLQQAYAQEFSRRGLQEPFHYPDRSFPVGRVLRPPKFNWKLIHGGKFVNSLPSEIKNSL